MSWGCIRMRSQDVIELFEHVPVGTQVNIIAAKLPKLRKYVQVPPVMIAANAPAAKPVPAVAPVKPATTERLSPIAAGPAVVPADLRRGAFAERQYPFRRPAGRRGQGGSAQAGHHEVSLMVHGFAPRLRWKGQDHGHPLTALRSARLPQFMKTLRLLLTTCCTLLMAASLFADDAKLYTIPLKDIDGKDTTLKDLRGQAAAHRQRGVEVRLHEAVHGARSKSGSKYKDKGLIVLGFPSQ